MRRRTKEIASFTIMALLLCAVGVGQSWSVSLAIINMCLISAIMAMGANIQWGYAGLVNFGVMGFTALGGLPGIERGLRTDINAGLSIDEGDLEGSVSFQDATKLQYQKGESSPTTSTSTGGQPGSFSDRIRVFKANVIPTKKATPLWKLMWRAYNDKVLLLLTGAAVISLALGVSIFSCLYLSITDIFHSSTKPSATIPYLRTL